MKRIFSLFLLLVAFNVSAVDIKPSYSGSWFNPDQDGHGLAIEVLTEHNTLIYWYVYHTDGTPMFLITVGNNQGNRITGPVYYHTGMKFGDFNPDDVEQTIWGSTTVTFNDCNHITFEYSLDDPAYGSGTIPMQRITSVAGMRCIDSPPHGNYTAMWLGSDGIGSGLVFMFENGDMVWSGEKNDIAEVGLGQWHLTGSNAFSFEGTTYSGTGDSVTASGSGTFDEDGITATLTGGGITGSGELSATPLPSFQRWVGTAEFDGLYDIHDSDQNLIGSANIHRDVQTHRIVEISLLDGCELVGDFDFPHPQFNQAKLEMDGSNCGATVKLMGAAKFGDRHIDVIATDLNSEFSFKMTKTLFGN